MADRHGEARPRPERPPGPLADCMDCRHWQAGTVVCRGNTMGRCGRDGSARSADSWCPDHEPAPATDSLSPGAPSVARADHDAAVERARATIAAGARHTQHRFRP